MNVVLQINENMKDELKPLTRSELNAILKAKEEFDTENANEPIKFCNRCKKNKYQIEFYNKEGIELKTCHKCRVICCRNYKKYMLKKKQQN